MISRMWLDPLKHIISFQHKCHRSTIKYQIKRNKMSGTYTKYVVLKQIKDFKLNCKMKSNNLWHPTLHIFARQLKNTCQCYMHLLLMHLLVPSCCVLKFLDFLSLRQIFLSGSYLVKIYYETWMVCRCFRAFNVSHVCVFFFFFWNSLFYPSL